jgi:hypothetical protein
MPRFHNINGTNVQFTADEETARDNEELIYANGAFDRAIAKLRQKRNRLLAETDYLALSDNILSSNMTTYRTALRDLTDNLTTVEEVDAVNFPTKP